jgi:hypothetical protein
MPLILSEEHDQVNVQNFVHQGKIEMYKILYILVVVEVRDQMPENQSTPPDESFTETVLEALTTSEKRSNRMILTGAPDWVRKIIHLMHIARITEVRDWSRLIPTRNPDEVISLMQRPRAEE